MHRYFTVLILYGTVGCLWISCQKEITSQQTLLPTPTQESLQDVYLLNDSIGFAMGGSTYSQSTLLHTTNGGQTWSLVDLGFDKIVYDMIFTTPSEGFLTGYDSKVLHTTDTGKTWIIEQLHGNLAWLPMYGIDFASSNTGVIVGGKGNSTGIIFQTANGGQTWQQTSYTAPSELRDIDFANATEAYAVGYGLILKTNDGGQTWQTLDAKGDFFFAVHFPTEQIGYVVGNQGTILKTSNSGYSWETLRNGNSPFKKRLHFTDVWFKDADNGFVLAENCLLQTTNGGETWQQYDLLCHTNKGLYFRSSDSVLLIVGEQGCISQIEVP